MNLAAHIGNSLCVHNSDYTKCLTLWTLTGVWVQNLALIRFCLRILSELNFEPLKVAV